MKLTASQQQAIESVDHSTAIIAGAGSGKTEVLTGRLLYLLKEKGFNLSQILCVTFTEKAAQEMKARVARQVDPEIKKELPWAAIGTFHGICLGILKEHSPRLGLPPLFSVWDEATAKLEIHRAGRQILLRALQEKEAAAVLLVETMEFRNALLLLEELMQFRWHWGRTTDHGLRTTDLKEKEL
ncbi:MAG: UvrD-helicase domain-containing protein, partial [Deltaproteobacteria bacterium]|nr:UvrD-helicase domain-containing protein [Deltaproteobacteria bacterium]